MPEGRVVSLVAVYSENHVGASMMKRCLCSRGNAAPLLVEERKRSESGHVCEYEG